MKVLVTGAGGFLGRYVVARLLERGYDVRAIIRPSSEVPIWQGNVEVFRADLLVHDDLLSAFGGIDAVIHLAAGTSGSEESQFSSSVIATERFLDAMAQSSTRRLILVSSLVVYDWSRAKGRLDESTPLLADIYGMGAYTIAKIWQERVVKKAAEINGYGLTIMRPGFIWGPQHTTIAGMGRRLKSLYIMFGPFTRLPLTYVENCADCLAATVDSPAAIGNVFNVVDDDSVRVWRYVKEYRKRNRAPGVMIPIPYRVGFGLAKSALFVSRRLFGKKGKLPSLLTPSQFEAQFKPVRFGHSKLTEIMGWKPPLTFQVCLENAYSKIA